MTNSVDRMIDKVGGHIDQSMGQGMQEGLAQKPAVPQAPLEGRLAGRYRHATAAVIEISRIVPDPTQPRKHFEQDELEKLAKSLRMHGQLQSVVCRWDEAQQKYILVTGERRLRAAKIAGLTKLKVEVIEKDINPGQILSAQLVENCVRQDMRPVELAEAYQRLAQFNAWNNAQVAEVLATTPGHVSKILSLLNLPADLKEQVNAGTIPSSTAYEIARLSDDVLRRKLAADFVAKRIDRDALIGQVQESVGKRKQSPKNSMRLCLHIEGAQLSIASAESITFEYLLRTLDSARKAVARAAKSDATVEAFARNLRSSDQ